MPPRPRRTFGRMPAHQPQLRADAPIAPPRLTARQQQILDWIRGHMEATGMPPTRAEIAAGLGFSTASSAEDHLQALAKKGALELTPGAARGLAPARHPGRADPRARCRWWAGWPRAAPSSPPSTSRRSTASTPRCSRRTPTTCCACKGASMQDAGILDGDLLVVHKTRRSAQRADRRRAPGRGSHGQTAETPRA